MLTEVEQLDQAKALFESYGFPDNVEILSDWCLEHSGKWCQKIKVGQDTCCFFVEFHDSGAFRYGVDDNSDEFLSGEAWAIITKSGKLGGIFENKAHAKNQSFPERDETVRRIRWQTIEKEKPKTEITLEMPIEAVESLLSQWKNDPKMREKLAKEGITDIRRTNVQANK